MRRLLALALFAMANSAHAGHILVADLSEAYTHSTALSGLLDAVDAELARIRTEYQPEIAKLQSQLRGLDKTQSAERLRIAREIHQIESAAEAAEVRLIEANQRAIATVDAAIDAAKTAVAEAESALALLDRNELLYVSPDCGCDRTAAVFADLNRRLPSVELQIDR